MKIARRLLFVAVVLILLISHSVRAEYRFSNGMESIVNIQLMQRISEESGDPSEYKPLRELSTNEIPSFMNEIYSLETQRGGSPPRWGYGEYIAKITYTNGDVEIFGSYCIEFIPSGEEQSGVGAYYFADEKAFLNLFQQYMSSSRMP